MSTKGRVPYTSARFEPGDVLVFGAETSGLPDDVLARGQPLRIPMVDGPIRSLNLANAVAVVAFEAMRQTRADLFEVP